MKDEIMFNQVVKWIEELQCQNSIDFQGIKNIKESIKKLNSEITKAKNLNNSINKKILSEYEKIKKIILDENVTVTLDNKISNVNKLLNDLKSNVYSLEDGQAFEKKTNESIKAISSQLEHKANEIFIESFEGENDNEKINNALKSITTSGVIKLKNKEYDFESIVLKRGVSLKGSGNTIINATRSGILIKTTDLNIVCDLNINDNGYKIKAIDVGQVGGSEKNYCNNCLVSGVNIHLNNTSSDGIRLGHGNNNKIDHNTIINTCESGEDNNQSIGIAVYSDTPNICKDVFVTNNYVSGFNKGISPWGTGTRINVQVINNIVENCRDIGINMYHSTLSQAINNNIYKCKIGIFADTTSYNDNRGRGTIVSNNSVHKCSKIGIYCEELRGGNVTNNAVQDCDIGIYGGAGINYTNFSNNTITFNRLGLMISNKYVPTPMYNYDNNSSVIKSNIITANKEHAILLSGVRGLWEISDNYICGNNTSNGDFYAIYLQRDIIPGQGLDRYCESFNIKNNTICNMTIDGTPGYQKGIYNNSGNIGTLVLINNMLQNKGHELTLTGFNKYSVIKDNVIIGDGKIISLPSCKIINNVGINEGDLITDKTIGVKLQVGLTSPNELPTADMSHDGRILKVNRRYDDSTSSYVDTEYYICNKQASGSYKWCKLQLS